jgi:ribosomal protein L35
MPKIKTRKTLLKRIKITKRGKILRKSSRTGHLQIKSDASSKSRKKNLSQLTNIGQIKVLKRLLAKFGRGVRN